MVINSKLFVCYSVPLMKFLNSNGFRYEVVGLNPRTKKTFWVYVRSKRLSGYLKKWEENNPNK